MYILFYHNFSKMQVEIHFGFLPRGDGGLQPGVGTLPVREGQAPPLRRCLRRDGVGICILPHPASPGAPSRRGPKEPPFERGCPRRGRGIAARGGTEAAPYKASLLEGGAERSEAEGEPSPPPRPVPHTAVFPSSNVPLIPLAFGQPPFPVGDGSAG